ncbi:AEC family transporter [Blautia sp. AF19-10LB]|mgnify:FL=1|jgi:predicted permease|uniref:AEC family transporter n=1 Tax=Blautia sp. AF19-10LB TaxID=2292961 RepID=UPI000E54AA46|nr:AEC family transporter [Blautia sp. AF19-10LB]RGG63528.1 AEC family transporter [Blautia sp. AF19-10LB]
MQISLLLMEEIIKLFVIMFMGYTVVKAGLMKSSESKSVSVIMVYLVIPCVILNAFQVEYTPDVQKGLLLACAAAVAVHILFLLLTAILKKPLHLDVIERATLIYSNAGILVIPLVQELLGQEYVIYSSAYIAVQLILIWTHCKNMLCEEEKLEWKKVLLNVNIISIIAGVVLFIFRIQLPSGAQDVLNMMNNMIGPLGMLLAGMVIAEVPLKTVFTRKRIYLSAALRLFIYPVFVLGLMKVIQTFASIQDSKQILLTVYLASITPACATVTSMAQLYDKDAAYSSSLYVLTTLLSIATMPVMVGLFEMVM